MWSCVFWSPKLIFILTSPLKDQILSWFIQPTLTKPTVANQFKIFFYSKWKSQQVFPQPGLESRTLCTRSENSNHRATHSPPTVRPQPTIDLVTLQYCDVTWLSKSRLIFMRSDDIQISPIYYRPTGSLSK